MGQRVKVAVYSVGAMVLGAIVFAMISNSKHPTPPASDVTISWQLDSLAAASDAPPPPVPDYKPTWIPVSGSGSATNTSTSSTSESSSSEPEMSPNQRALAAGRDDEPATQAPPPDAARSDQSSQSEPQQSVSSSPNNNTELRGMLRRGK